MASKANITLDQGTTFTAEIDVTNEAGDPLDLSGYTIEATIKKWYTSTNSVSFTANGTANGVINLGMDANTSINSLKSGQYVYDVITVDSSNTIIRILEGTLTVNPNVTVP